MSKTFTKVNVTAHGKPDSLWVVIDEDVYDLTSFQDDHPGMLLCLFYFLS
jgi:cytochrome b involved in lipid metabolism